MQPIIRRIFHSVIGDVQLNSKKIAKILKDAITNHSLPHGSKLVLPNRLAKYLQVNLKLILAAYEHLEKKETLVKKQSVYVYTVSVPENCSNDLEPAVNKNQVYFDKLDVPGRVQDTREMNTAVGKRKVLFQDMLEAKQGHNRHPQLVRQFRTKVNAALAHNYTQLQVAYAMNAKHMIYAVTSELVSSRQTLVLPDYTPRWIADVMVAAAKKVVWITTDNEGKWLQDLKVICEREKVALLYLSSRASYPFDTQLSPGVVEQLRAMQKKHSFKILEDDRFASCCEEVRHPLEALIWDKEVEVIYMRQLSRFTGDTAKLTIVTGPQPIIAGIREKLLNSGESISNEMVYSIYQVLSNGDFKRIDERTNHNMALLSNKVQQMLADSGLWQPDANPSPASWTFYLHPVEGTFPPDVYEKLLLKGISVVNPSDYGHKPNKPGVTISLGAFLREEDKLLKALQQLIEYLQSLIIYQPKT